MGGIGGGGGGGRDVGTPGLALLCGIVLGEGGATAV